MTRRKFNDAIRKFNDDPQPMPLWTAVIIWAIAIGVALRLAGVL